MACSFAVTVALLGIYLLYGALTKQEKAWQSPHTSYAGLGKLKTAISRCFTTLWGALGSCLTQGDELLPGSLQKPAH